MVWICPESTSINLPQVCFCLFDYLFKFVAFRQGSYCMLCPDISLPSLWWRWLVYHLYSLFFPLSMTLLMHFFGFTFKPAQLSFSFNLFSKCFGWTVVSVIVAISPINRHHDTCCCPDDVFGPFVSSLTDITSMVLFRAKRIMLSVHPLIIPFSTLCHFFMNC